MPPRPPDATAPWGGAGRTIQAQVWEHLGRSTAKPGAPGWRGAVLHDPRDQAPLVVTTNRPVSASALWCLSRDRWPIEPMPLAATQMVGAHRAFVFGDESRHRLPAVALLAGKVLASAAAPAPAVAPGLWDRCCRPTCGRWRRVLWRVDFSEIPVPEGPRRKKASGTGHVPTGVQEHRRRQRLITLSADSLPQSKVA